MIKGSERLAGQPPKFVYDGRKIGFLEDDDVLGESSIETPRVADGPSTGSDMSVFDDNSFSLSDDEDLKAKSSRRHGCLHLNFYLEDCQLTHEIANGFKRRISRSELPTLLYV